MFLKTAVLLLGFLALVRSQTTSVSPCESNEGELPINIYIENCPTPPCLLPKLQDVVLHLVFKAPHTMRSMTTLATAYVMGNNAVPYPLGAEAITCNFLTNTYCPVLANEVVTYTLRMYIASWMPANFPVTIEFRIVDENSVPVTCLRVPISITNPVATAQGTGLETRNGTLVAVGNVLGK